MDKSFLEGVASQLNIKADEVAEYFVTEGEETKLKDGIDPLQVVRGWVKTRTDDIYKAAERKTAQRFESWVKSKGFESDAQGTDLLEAYFSSIEKTGSGEGSEPGELQKEYESLKAAHQRALDQLKAKDQEIEKIRQESQQKIVGARLESDIRAALGKEWAGTDDHFRILMSSFSPNSVQYGDNGPTLLDGNGEPRKDDLHRPVSFADEVKRLGALIGGFHKVDPGKNGAPPPKGTSGADKVSLPANLSHKDYNEMLDNERDPAKRAAMIKARIEQLESEGK